MTPVFRRPHHGSPGACDPSGTDSGARPGSQSATLLIPPVLSAIAPSSLFIATSYGPQQRATSGHNPGAATHTRAPLKRNRRRGRETHHEARLDSLRLQAEWGESLGLTSDRFTTGDSLRSRVVVPPTPGRRPAPHRITDPIGASPTVVRRSASSPAASTMPLLSTPNSSAGSRFASTTTRVPARSPTS